MQQSQNTSSQPIPTVENRVKKAEANIELLQADLNALRTLFFNEIGKKDAE